MPTPHSFALSAVLISNLIGIFILLSLVRTGIITLSLATRLHNLNLDPLSLLGVKATTVVHYYLIFLVVLAVIILFIYHLYQSRIGRAWRAMRED